MNRESLNTKKYDVRAASALWRALAFALLAAALALAAAFAPACRQAAPAHSSYTPNTAFPEQFYGYAAGKKVYITSIGQSVELIQLTLTMTALGMSDYTEDNLLEASEVEEGAVVFVVVGSSLKSLTENGLTRESEAERAKAFIARAERGDFGLVCWHIGGVARRGSTSDSLIELLFGNCDLALFRAESNYDLKLSDWAIAAGVPYCQFGSGMTDTIKQLFGGADV